MIIYNKERNEIQCFSIRVCERINCIHVHVATCNNFDSSFFFWLSMQSFEFLINGTLSYEVR